MVSADEVTVAKNSSHISKLQERSAFLQPINMARYRPQMKSSCSRKTINRSQLSKKSRSVAVKP